MDEVELLRRMATTIRDPDEAAVESAARQRLISHRPGAPHRTRRRVILATLSAVLLFSSGFATAGIIGKDEGAGVNAPAEQKIPFVVEGIKDLEGQLAEIPKGSTDAADVARRGSLEYGLVLLQAALDRLCGELDPGQSVAGCEDEGARVNARAERMIPFVVEKVVEKIEKVEGQLADIPKGSTDAADLVRRFAYEQELSSLKVALDRLCGELDPRQSVAGCKP